MRARLGAHWKTIVFQHFVIPIPVIVPGCQHFWFILRWLCNGQPIKIQELAVMWQQPGAGQLVWATASAKTASLPMILSDLKTRITLLRTLSFLSSQSSPLPLSNIITITNHEAWDVGSVLIASRRIFSASLSSPSWCSTTPCNTGSNKKYQI